MSLTDALIPITFNNVYIGGEYRLPQSKGTFSFHNPKDGTLVAENFAIAGQADVDASVRHVEEAF